MHFDGIDANIFTMWKKKNQEKKNIKRHPVTVFLLIFFAK
jgi:hypothetical protein